MIAITAPSIKIIFSFFMISDVFKVILLFNELSIFKYALKQSSKIEIILVNAKLGEMEVKEEIATKKAEVFSALSFYSSCFSIESVRTMSTTTFTAMSAL